MRCRLPSLRSVARSWQALLLIALLLAAALQHWRWFFELISAGGLSRQRIASDGGGRRYTFVLADTACAVRANRGRCAGDRQAKLARRTLGYGSHGVLQGVPLRRPTPFEFDDEPRDKYGGCWPTFGSAIECSMRN